MGNHEYCMACGESDFHWNRPCDPEKLAEKKREKAKQKEYERQLIVAAKALQKDLEKLGHRVYNVGTHLDVWPRLPGEKPYKPLKHRQCATPGCENNPGGNGWDEFKYCDDCDSKGKR